MERQAGRVSSTFRHVVPMEEGEAETVMDLKKLKKHERASIVDRGEPLVCAWSYLTDTRRAIDV